MRVQILVYVCVCEMHGSVCNVLFIDLMYFISIIIEKY